MSLILLSSVLLATGASQNPSGFASSVSGAAHQPPASGSSMTSSPGGASSSCSGFEYTHDDGSSESNIGLISGGGILWQHAFNAVGGSDVITTISTAYGTPGFPIPAGAPVTIGIWNDPTNDLDPTDAVLLWSSTTVSSNENTDILNDYAVPNVPVNGVFFIGVLCEHPVGQYPASRDTGTAALGRAWVAGNEPSGGGYAGFDMSDLTNNTLAPVDVDAVNLPGVFLLRAVGGTSTYSHDSGSTMNAWGGADNQHAWLQGYDSGSGDTIHHVETAYGSGLFPGTLDNGLPVELGIWNDPTNDFDPSDAVLLWSLNTTTVNACTDLLNSYDIFPPVSVTGVFFVGAVCDHPGQYPAPMDQSSASLGRAWLATNSGAPFDMGNLTNNAFGPVEMDANGVPTVWMIRACGTGNYEPTSYCNPANANSVAPGGAVLTSTGGFGTMAADFVITDLPPGAGILFSALNQVQVPFGCGELCVVGSITRFNVTFSQGGSVSTTVDMSAPGLNRIQYWYRDPSNQSSCGNVFNTSNALTQ